MKLQRRLLWHGMVAYVHILSEIYERDEYDRMWMVSVSKGGNNMQMGKEK